MNIDFKLLEYLKKVQFIWKPRLLNIIINQNQCSQTIKEIIILDRAFDFWLEKTEIEVF